MILSFFVVSIVLSRLFYLLCATFVACIDVARPTIDQLTDELREMNDWYKLGVQLRMPVAVLEQIVSQSPHGGIQRWRIDLLQRFLDSTPTASWRDIITALEKIGHRTLSARLKSKYLKQTTGNCIIISSIKSITYHAERYFLSKLCNGFNKRYIYSSI